MVNNMFLLAVAGDTLRTDLTCFDYSGDPLYEKDILQTVGYYEM